jgi:hypothetical protein
MRIILIFLLIHSSISDVVETCSTDDQNTCKSNDNNTNDVKIPKGSNAQGIPRKVDLSQCYDRYEQCAEYARQGECEINPGWMIVSCPRSCEACHLLDPKARCPRHVLNISSIPIYKPGNI